MKKSKYGMSGGKKTKYGMSGGKKTKYGMSGGKMTEVGKERTVEQYKDYVKRMFGGGSTSTPSTQRHRAKGMAVGGKTTKGKARGGKV